MESREPVFPSWPLELVRPNFKLLTATCNPAELADALFQEGLLTSRELKLLDRDLRVKVRLEEDVNRWLLLEVFPCKGPGAFDRFVRVLVHADRAHRSLIANLKIPVAFKEQMDRLKTSLSLEGESLDSEFSDGKVSTAPMACTDD